MKDDKIWDIHDIGNRGEAAKNGLGSRRESKCESSGLLFFIGNARVARPWQEFFIEGRPGRRRGKERSSEVAEQGDGDEMHLAEGMVDGMIRRL